MKDRGEMDDVSALVKDVEYLEYLPGRDWESLLRVIKRNPAKHLGQLVQLKLQWKDSLARKFAGQLPYGGDKELLLIMLQLGADPNSILHDEFETSTGRTPLIWAAAAGSYECCEVLLQHGATPNIQGGPKRTALHEAAAKGSDACCDLLLRHGANPNALYERQSPLNCAAEVDSVECCTLLIKHGANVKNEDCIPPLFDAARAGSVTCCELFLKHGCDSNIGSVDQSMPLHEAALASSVECCQLLLQHGADPCATNHSKESPLHLAARSGSAACCAILLQYGSDPNTENRDKEIALHEAAKVGSTFCCEVLLQHGSDPNKQDQDGSTPLHAAIDKSVVECCEILVSYGADAMKKDREGRLPMERARSDDDPTRMFLISQIYVWNADMFRELCKAGKTAMLRRYLDNFRLLPHPPRQPSRTTVYYHDLYEFYGPPWLPINDTPFYQVMNGADDVPSLVDHPVFEHVLNIKWAPHEGKSDAFSAIVPLFDAMRFQIGLAWTMCFQLDKTFFRHYRAFGRLMYISDSLWFLSLLVSTYLSFVSADAIVGRSISMVTAVIMLMMEGIDWNKRRWSYFKDAINWINLGAYGGVLVLGVLTCVRNELPHVDIARALFVVLLSFCGLEYLRMVPLTSLLIAITFKMVQDVIKFIVLYGVFQIGFSGSFYLLFLHEQSAKAVVANVLVLLYLVGAMVMLMNLLIAMMSTSYQEVLDSAKVARSIARAETILRMESLLPQRVRVHMFDSSFNVRMACLSVYERHTRDVAEQKAKNEASLAAQLNDADMVHQKTKPLEKKKGIDTSRSPLLEDASSSHHTSMDAEASHNVQETSKASEGRPVDQTTGEHIELFSKSQNRGSVRKTKAKAPRKPIQIDDVSNRLRKKYTSPFARPCLEDCELLEYVDGNESFQRDLQQAHAKLETKLEKGHEQLALQLNLLKQEIQNLEQRQQQQTKWQEHQAKLQELQFKQLEEIVLSKLVDLQRQLAISDSGGTVASPTKRFSLKK